MHNQEFLRKQTRTNKPINQPQEQLKKPTSKKNATRAAELNKKKLGRTQTQEGSI